MLELLHTSRLWPKVQALRGRGPVVAAVAYATADHLKLRARDILICDASHSCIASGGTSAALLSELAARGVRLYSLDTLHAKVIRMARHVVVGSANMTTNSKGLVEAAVLTDDPAAIQQADAMLQGLLRHDDLQTIDGPFLERISAIEVTPGGRGGAGRGRKRQTHPNREARAWLMGYRLYTPRQLEKAEGLITSTTGMDEIPPFMESTAKEADKFGHVQIGDTLYLADRVNKRLRYPVVVTGVLPIREAVFHFHAGTDDRGITWPRVLAKLKDFGAYSGPGIPQRLALSADAAAMLDTMLRGRKT